MSTRYERLEELFRQVQDAINGAGAAAWEQAREEAGEPYTTIEQTVLALGGEVRGAKPRRPRRHRIHYAIMGSFTGKQIGCCWGEEGRAAAQREEPSARIVKMPQRLCPICSSTTHRR